MLNLDPISKISPVTPVAPIATPIQGLDAQANQLVKGQVYIANVQSKVQANIPVIVQSELQAATLAKTQITQQALLQSKAMPPSSAQLTAGNGNQLYQVRLHAAGSQDVSGEKSPPLLINMRLSQALAESGQPMSLRFLQSQPVPTFQLLASNNNALASQSNLSSIAQLIGDVISQSNSLGTSSRYEAVGVVTKAPHNPQVIANDLAESISKSGLFYESHLNDLVKGKTNVAALMQEPQNLVHTPSTELIAQQLSVLEHQRLSWQGEIWKGQPMRWDVQLPEQDDAHSQGNASSEPNEEQAITSQITLHLPQLGKVMANISILDGRLRVGMQVDNASTLQMLKQHAPSLSQALQSSGQQLEGLQVTQYAA
jgi:hypothetical protein